MGLLRWLGFVKLADFGLELTPDRRIRSRRWVVFDDGGPGAIVGWTADDASVQELTKWELVKPKANVESDDDWEWLFAIACARAGAAPAPEPSRPIPEPAIDAQAQFIDELPTQARITDDTPTALWLEGNTEIDPTPSVRFARGTPSPLRPAMRKDPWRHEPTVPASNALQHRKK